MRTMSPRKPNQLSGPPEPTEAELEVLRVLWQQGAFHCAPSA